MSTHEVKVVKIEEIFPHNNADSLSIIKVWDYQCVVKKDQFKMGDLICYLEPDYLVPLNRLEFSFLDDGKGKEKQRITTRKFRGEVSYGLVIKAPEGAIEGDNVMEQLGVERYEPPMGGHNGSGPTGFLSGICETGPEFSCPVYDLENFKKFRKLIPEKAKVIYSAKIHGTNSRYVWSSKEKKMFCGSRTTWKKQPGIIIKTVMVLDENGVEQPKEIVSPKSCWWECLYQNPWIEEWCKNNPDQVLYGEVYGPNIQGTRFHYGMKDGQYGFAVFDILRNGNWVDNEEVYFKTSGIKTVKVLYVGELNVELLKELAEQSESFNDCGHVREGVVVKTTGDNRIALKWVSDQYYAIK